MRFRNFCFRYVAIHEHPDEQRRAIERAAYQHGLPAEQILRVLAIELRDRLLKLVGKEPPE